MPPDRHRHGVRGFRVAIWVLAILAGACAPQRGAVHPDAPRLGRMLDGRRAAAHPIEIAGRRAGEVRIRSVGVFRTTYEDQERTLIALEVEIDNRGPEPLTFSIDNVALGVDIDDPPLATAASALTVGEPTAAPFHYRHLRYFIPLPGNIAPQTLDHFTVHWHINTGGHLVAERTAFVEDLVERPRMRAAAVPPSLWPSSGAAYLR